MLLGANTSQSSIFSFHPALYRWCEITKREGGMQRREMQRLKAPPEPAK